MGLKIFKGLLRIWCWFLICMGLLIAFSGTVSVICYFSPEADIYGWDRLWTTLISLLIAALGAGAAWCGFRLQASVNGRQRPLEKKPVPEQKPQIQVVQADDVITLQWSQVFTTKGAECRAAAEGYMLCVYELHTIKDQYEPVRKELMPWEKIDGRLLENQKEFESYIGRCLGLDAETAALAAKKMMDFIAEREKRPEKEKKPYREEVPKNMPAPTISTLEPVKKPDFTQMSNITVKRTEDTIVLRWRKAGTSDSAECRAAEDGYELYFVRNIHDRRSAIGKPWLKISVRQTDSRKGFENYIGWALELNGSPASEAAEHIRKFILDRERRTGKKAKPSKAPAGGKLADRIRHGYEKPDGGRNSLTLYEMQGIFLAELFSPQVTDVSEKRGWREWIGVDIRDSRPYYVISANEIVDGRRTRYYDVKEPVTWEEVVSFARTTTDAYGKKYLEASKDTWMQCKELWKRSHVNTENSISITWNETLKLRKEVRCDFNHGRYEVFYGGQHGPEDRTGFGVTEVVPPEACESLSAMQEFAKGKFESETGSIFGFISKHQEERLMKARGVTRPPLRMWGLDCPPFPHERYIALKREGRPPHEYEHEALVKVSGGWFHHSEAAWRGGYSHSDGGCNDIYLKDVNDENVEEYVRKHKRTGK